MDTVLIPRDNAKDLVEIPKNVKDRLNIVPVKWIDEVIELALQYSPAPNREESAGGEQRETQADDSAKSEVILPH